MGADPDHPAVGGDRGGRLADPSLRVSQRWPGGRLARAVFALVLAPLILASAGLAAAAELAPAPGPARRELVAPYLRALEARAVGDVDGRAYGEPRRPSGPPVPLDGVSVLLLPFAAEVEAQLDAIKTHLRDSITSYVEAYADVTAVRLGYERELLAAGGGELIRGAVSDAAGTLRLAGLPSGEWLLLAWREEAHVVKGAKAAPKDASRYQDIPVMTGYATVSFWRMRVLVRPGDVTAVHLSDRGVWLAAVREERSHPDEASSKGKDSKKRR